MISSTMRAFETLSEMEDLDQLKIAVEKLDSNK